MVGTGVILPWWKGLETFIHTKCIGPSDKIPRERDTSRDSENQVDVYGGKFSRRREVWEIYSKGELKSILRF